MHIICEKHQFRVQVDVLIRGVDKIEICGMLVTQWYMFQLHRNGQGLAPDPEMDPWMVYEKITGKSRPMA